MKNDPTVGWTGKATGSTCEAYDIDLGTVEVVAWVNKDLGTVDISLHKNSIDEEPSLVVHMDPCEADILGQGIDEATGIMHGDE